MSAGHRIAVVDDVAAIRNSLKALLETYGYEVAVYDSAERFFADVDSKGLSAVLFDVRMPRMNGLEAQRLLKERAPWLPAIIITGHGDIDMAVGAMKEGAFDFIEKPIDDERLVASIAQAVSRAVEVKEGDSRRAQSRLKYERLTSRERDVMRLVADGYSTLAIASVLSISARTVDHHRASIHAKLEVTSLSQLIKLAIEISHD
jgi:two-component system, LuxR family, response regulator FixJ